MTYVMQTELTWSRTMADLAETMRRWKVKTWSIHCDLQPRYTNKRYQTPQEREVGILIVHPVTGQEITLTMGQQERAVDNLRVLYLAVDSLRLNELRGVAEVVQSAYLQLAPPQRQVARDPYEILGVRPDTDLDDIRAVYRSKAKRLHQDSGGNDAAMKELNEAWETVQRERA